MSHNPRENLPTPPKTERWVFIMAFSFFPVVVALMLPDAARIPLLAIAGLMFIGGFILMLIESRRSRGHNSLRQLVHSDPE